MQMAKLGGGDEVNKFVNSKSTYAREQVLCVAKPFLSGIDQTQALKPAMQDWAADQLRSSSEKLCKHPVSTEGLQVHTKSFTNPASYNQSNSYMMSLLNNGRPFALHYDVGLLAKGFENRSGWHASVVVGRRWHNGTCQLHIKNSWGDSCAEAKVPETCEHGYWWADMKMFDSSATEVMHIEKTGK